MKKVLKFLLFTIIVHALLYGFYLLTSNGLADKTIYLQLRRYIPCAIAVASTVWLWRPRLPLSKLLPHVIIG